jgi:hypothetical protein
MIGRQLDRDAKARAGAGEILPPDFLDRITRGNAVSFTLPDGSAARGWRT